MHMGIWAGMQDFKASRVRSRPPKPLRSRYETAAPATKRKHPKGNRLTAGAACFGLGLGLGLGAGVWRAWRRRLKSVTTAADQTCDEQDKGKETGQHKVTLAHGTRRRPIGCTTGFTTLAA